MSDYSNDFPRCLSDLNSAIARISNNDDRYGRILSNTVSLLIKHYHPKGRRDDFEGYIRSIRTNNLTIFCATFCKCESLENLNVLNYWDVSNGTDFEYMFSECKFLKDISGLSNWNVSKGINFMNMFHECEYLKNIEPLSHWNVSNGTNFCGMFWGCESLETLEGLSHWDVSKGTNFYGMFYGCDHIMDISPLANWTVPRKYDVKWMFIIHGETILPENISQDQIDWLNINIKRHD